MIWLCMSYIACMLSMIGVIVMGVPLFPQRLDEALDVAGEDSSQAEEAVPGDTADAGKPSSKLKPMTYIFYSLLYHAIVSPIITSFWDGIIVVVLGKPPHTYIPYLFGKMKIEL